MPDYRRLSAEKKALFLDAITSCMDLAFYVRDVEGRYVFVSEGYCQLLGVKAEDVIGRRACDFMDDDLAAHVDEVNSEVLRSGGVLVTEETYIIRGKPRHFRVHRAPVKAENGVVGVLGFAFDQTERLELVRRTMALNEILALLGRAHTVEAYADGLLEILLSEIGCSMGGVRAYNRLLDGDDDQARKRAPFVAARGLAEDLVEAANTMCLDGDKCPCAAVLSGDLSVLKPVALDEHGCLFVDDTRAVWGGADASDVAAFLAAHFGTIAVLPLRYREEELGCILLGDRNPHAIDSDAKVFLKNILPVVAEGLRRFIMQRRLEISRSRLESVVNSMPIPIWVVNPRYKVVFRNHVHVRLFGEADPDAPCYKTLRGQDKPCEDCDFADTLLRVTTRKEWCDPKTERTFDVIAAPYDSLSGERQRLEVFYEVTERVRAEAQLRQSQRLDSLGSLAAGIAHDFNNILTGIIGYCQLGLQHVQDQSEGRRILQQIEQIASRGSDLTRKILAFSRRQPLKVSTVNLNAVVMNINTMLEPLVGDTIEVVLDLEKQLWAIEGDQSEIEHVIMNLCVNAIEAMPGGGTLCIRTYNASPQHLQRFERQFGAEDGIVGKLDRCWVLVEVSDTGHGMSQEVLAHALEPFFTTKGRGRGTGLGLSVAHAIVRQHRGHMAIESRVGQGTTVSVFFPSLGVTPVTAAARTKRAQVLEPLQSRKSAGRILVVEDDQPIRDLIATFLKDLGYEALTASGVSEALDILRLYSGNIALVLTDVAMPGVGGTELARIVQTTYPEVPVLYISGCSDAALERYGVSDSCLLLRKPFTLEELATFIEKGIVKRP